MVWGKHLRTALTVGLIGTLAGTGSATANLDIRAIDLPMMGGSWYQDFRVSADSSFTQLGVSLAKPDTSAYFGLVNSPYAAMDFTFGTPGWAQTFFGPFPTDTGSMAIAEATNGSGVYDLLWRAHFADPLAQAFTMTVFAFDDITTTTLFDSATASWDGSDWSYDAVPGMSWEEFQGAVATSIPVPASALLGVLGLGLVAGIVRLWRQLT